MAVPSFDSLMLPVLEALVDGGIHRPQEVSDRVAVRLGVTAEDQAEMLPSGAMPRYRNRVLWALHYMKRAGVIASPGRGQYVIADSGRALLAEAPAKITTKTLERYPGYMEFVGRTVAKPQDPDVIDVEVATPEERLQAAYEEVRAQAKRYNSPVDVKLIREFAGSLDEHGTDKGVFFTTDKFTGPAMDFARSIKKRIVLIDGPELARLMVRHRVGVTVTKTLPLARLDSDYFDPGMEA